jgi:hypothetical protein
MLIEPGGEATVVSRPGLNRQRRHTEYGCAHGSIFKGAMKISTNQSVFLNAVSTAILESRERSYRSVPDCRDTQVDFIRAKVMPVPELETATAVESPWLPVHQLRLSEHLRNTGGRSGVESSSQPFAPSIVSGVRRTCWHTQCSLSFVFDCRLPVD